MTKVVRREDWLPDWRKRLDRATGANGSSALPQRTPRPGLVYLVIDCSISMAGNKLEQARSGALGFAEQALSDGYRVGLIRFSSSARLLCELQQELASLARAAADLKAGGNTNMAKGIRLADETLADARGARAICIVTDGDPNSREAALQAAVAAKQRGIDILAIGTDDADQAFLSKLVTRRELARHVQSVDLQSGITHMARLLPRPR